MSLREPLLKKLSKQAVCCEIGVDKGDFSQELLQITKPEEIHLIDPWDYFEDPKYVKSRYGGKKGVSKKNMDNRYNDVIKRFSNNKNVIIHRGYSKDILSKFPDAFFDWIYIDIH